MAGSSEQTQAAVADRATVVNRTHRVIRERALAMQKQKRTARDLLVPCLVCSAVLLVIATAIWTVADDGIPGWEEGLWRRISLLGADAGSTISILLVWFLPLSVITAAIVMLRRSRAVGMRDEVRR